MNRIPIDADKVAPKLYVGGAPRPGEYSDFQVLVLCAREIQPKTTDFPGLKIIRAGFDDTLMISDQDLESAVSAAIQVIRELKKGQRVLVTCAAGLNRSALVAGLAMKRHWKLPTEQVVNLIRTARGASALSNYTFVSILERW